MQITAYIRIIMVSVLHAQFMVHHTLHITRVMSVLMEMAPFTKSKIFTVQT